MLVSLPRPDTAMTAAPAQGRFDSRSAMAMAVSRRPGPSRRAPRTLKMSPKEKSVAPQRTQLPQSVGGNHRKRSTARMNQAMMFWSAKRFMTSQGSPPPSAQAVHSKRILRARYGRLSTLLASTGSFRCGCRAIWTYHCESYPGESGIS
jgi:hypothetical protein